MSLTEVTVVELARFDPDGGARADVDAQTDHVVQFKVGKSRRDVAGVGRHPNAPRYISPGVAERNTQMKSTHRTKIDFFFLPCTAKIVNSHLKFDITK